MIESVGIAYRSWSEAIGGVDLFSIQKAIFQEIEKGTPQRFHLSWVAGGSIRVRDSVSFIFQTEGC